MPVDLENGATEYDIPQASTSAVTLDNGHQSSISATALPVPLQPSKPWGLADYGIPPPPTDLLPDPAVEVSFWEMFDIAVVIV